jgi:hypothetical protein
MPLPSGVTYCTVVSVDSFDTKTNKPTMCTLKYDVNGVEQLGQFNIGTGFLASFNAAVVATKKQVTDITAAQTIVGNKTA